MKKIFFHILDSNNQPIPDIEVKISFTPVNQEDPLIDDRIYVTGADGEITDDNIPSTGYILNVNTNLQRGEIKP